MTLRGFQSGITLMELASVFQWVQNPERAVDVATLGRVCTALADCTDQVSRNEEDDFFPKDFFRSQKKNGVEDSLEDASVFLRAQDMGRQWCGLRAFFKHYRNNTSLNETLYEYVLPDQDLVSAVGVRVGVYVMLGLTGSSIGSLFELHGSSQCIPSIDLFKKEVSDKIEALATLQDLGIVTGLAQHLRQSGSFVFAQAVSQWAILAHEYRVATDVTEPRDALWDSARDYACLLERFGNFHEAGLVRSYVETERRCGDATQTSKIKFLKRVRSQLRQVDKIWREIVLRPRFGRDEMGSWMSRLYATEMTFQNFWKYILGDPSIGEYFAGFINEQITTPAFRGAKVDAIINKVPVENKVSEELFLVIDVLKLYRVSRALDTARYHAYGAFEGGHIDSITGQIEIVKSWLDQLENSRTECDQRRFENLVTLGGLIDALLVFLHEKSYLGNLRVDRRRYLQENLVGFKKRWAAMFDEGVRQMPYSFWISEMLRHHSEGMIRINGETISIAKQEVQVRIERAQEVDLALRLKVFAVQQDDERSPIISAA